MSMNDTLAAALSKIMNAEKIGQNECIIKPQSKIIKNVLDLMNKEHFIGAYQEVEDGKGGFLKVNLIGSINNCGVVKPRFAVKKDNLEKFEKRFLPSKDFGLLIMSTTEGMMTHQEAKKKNVGGKLLVYCY